ncbi:MAG: TonB family protein [Aquimonas sp.]|nr:TonB family protein [Aquimonas sp.]
MSSANELLELLLREGVELVLASSAACALVLLLRLPVRRTFGARAAYALWWLLPATLLAVSLPAPVATQAVMTVAPAAGTGGVLMLGPNVQPVAAQSALPILLGLLWVLGSGAALWLLAIRQLRFNRSLGRIRPVQDGLWKAEAREGLPAVIGLRPRIVLPADFEHRYAPDQQALVIAHERVHARRGDTLWNLLFALLCVWQWFNPLLRIAERAFRLDQELACDAHVLAEHPQGLRSYGEALLEHPSHFPAAPLGCPAFGTHPLKERITMLTRPLPSLNRIAAGFALSLGLGLAFAGLAWAHQAPRAAEAAVELPRPQPMVLSEAPAGDELDATYSRLPPPKYPAEAVAKRQEGKVVLAVEVLPDGGVGEARVEQSSGSTLLDAAALETARQWQFNATRKDGEAITSWVQVPVDFSLDNARGNQERVETPPSYARLSPPEYPASAKAAGLEGTTLLRVGIDTDGKVLTVDIESSAGSALLDQSAAKAVEAWTFNPARNGEQAMRSQVLVPVQFLAANSSLSAYVAPAGALDTITLRAE